MMIVGCKLAQEAVQKLTHNLLRVSKQAMYVFKDKDLWLLVRLTRFMYGYVTWHLSSKRCRMNEIYEQASEDVDMGQVLPIL